MRYRTKNDDNDWVERYGIKCQCHAFVPCMNVDATDTIVDRLLAERIEAIQARDTLLAEQKAAGRSDPEAARAFKELARGQMRRYRAICLHVPWFVARPPGDCRTLVPPALWPLEIEEELDDIGTMICAMGYEPEGQEKADG